MNNLILDIYWINPMNNLILDIHWINPMNNMIIVNHTSISIISSRWQNECVIRTRHLSTRNNQANQLQFQLILKLNFQHKRLRFPAEIRSLWLIVSVLFALKCYLGTSKWASLNYMYQPKYDICLPLCFLASQLIAFL